MSQKNLFAGLALAMLSCPAAVLAQSPPLDPALQECLESGQQDLSAHRFKSAIQAFKKCSKLRRDDCFPCFVGMTRAYQALGDSKAALQSSERALASANTLREEALAHNLKGAVLVSQAAEDRKALRAAETEFREALKADEMPTTRLNLGVVLLRESHDEEGVQELNAYLNAVPEGAGAAVARKLIANPRRANLKPAPEFEFTTVQGNELSLSRLEGRIVVLDFWATWCRPCVSSVPELADLVKKHAERPLVVISISVDDDEKPWREFIRRKNMSWPQVRDSSHDLTSRFGIQAFPTYVVIDGQGFIRQRIVGASPQETIAHRLKATLESMPELKAPE